MKHRPGVLADPSARWLQAGIVLAVLFVLLLMGAGTSAALAAALALMLCWTVVQAQILTKRLRRLASLCTTASGSEEQRHATVPRADGLAQVANGIQALIDKVSQERTGVEDSVRLRTEELQQSLERAKRVMATKANSIAVISHEVRTPMNAVLGASELLLETDLDDHQRELMQTVRSSGGLLLELINDVLDFSKLEAGRIELEQIPFDIESELETVLRAFEDKARSQGLCLGIEFDSALDPLVIGDSLRLRQVVMNLVSNAVKFTSQGGVTVRVRRGSVGPSMVAFEVEDTGIGIPDEALPKLFQAFAQADSSTTREYGGTGLGLSICKQLVEAMGGNITVASEHGIGSVFRFEVELTPMTAEQRFTFAVASGLQGLSVLVISDEHELIQWIGRVLACYQAEARWTLQEAALAAIDVGGADQPDVLVVAVQSLCERESLARLLARTHIPLLVLGGTSLETGSAKHLRRLPERPRRRALLECLGELMSGLQEADRAVGPSSQGPRVLLAEDNAVNQKVAEAMLRQFGCDVVIAEDGVCAVEAHAGAAFDLVLMDYQMPRLDGPDAARRIRAEESMHGRARTPIVAVTANAGKDFEARCEEAGMDGFLTKPLQKSDLRQLLDRVVSGAPIA